VSPSYSTARITYFHGKSDGFTPSTRRHPPTTERKYISRHFSLRESSGDGKSSTSAGRQQRRSKNNGKRWHRRIFSKLRSTKREISPAAPLRMTAVDQETEALLESIASYSNNQDFILRNFESITPDMVLLQDDDNSETFTASPLGVIDSEFYDVSITPASKRNSKASATDTAAVAEIPRNSSFSMSRMMGKLVENILTSRIVQHASENPESLSVEVEPLGKALTRLLLRGQFRANAKVSTGRLVFPPIRFSSGKVELERVTLNLLSFLHPSNQNHQQNASSKRGVVRYPKQFDLHIEDLTMSRHDLLFSPCVKNGLRTLLINILRDRGLQSSSIRISSIDILSTGKISCIGEAKTHFGSAPIPFEVRSGISFASRGHVLTFPGLEISLNRDIGFFVPVVPTLDLDVGHNARFRRIVIDGKKKQIQLDASVTITPDRTIRLMQDYKQSSDAFSARFFYDVGRWLTRLGKFTK